MSNEATRALERRLAARIRSHKVSDSAYSVFGRIHDTHIDAAAAAIARSYPTSELTDEDLRRVLMNHETRYGAAFRTTKDVTAAVNLARLNEQKKVVIRDITKPVLNKMTALERLNYVNTNGELPTRFVLKGPQDA